MKMLRNLTSMMQTNIYYQYEMPKDLWGRVIPHVRIINGMAWIVYQPY